METKKKIAVIGSRSIQNKQIVFDFLNKNYDRIECIVSGGATGPDQWAADYSKEKGFSIIIHYPRWRDKNGVYDAGAGFKRNIKIIQDCDVCVAFHQNKSKGTSHSIDLAKKYNKKLIVIEVPDGQ